MYGLRFETAAPPLRPDPNRVDVACFIGHVARRPGALPPAVIEGLAAQGWVVRDPGLARGWAPGPWRADAGEIEALLQLPVAVESWAAFDALFAWEARPLQAGQALRQNMVRAPDLFQSGASVRVVVQGQGYAGTASGQAMSAGAQGQNVRVRMANGRIVAGIVLEDGTIEATL